MSSDITDSMKAIINFYFKSDTDIEQDYSLGLEYPSDITEYIGEEDTHIEKILLNFESLKGRFHITDRETKDSETIIIDKEMQERTSECAHMKSPYAMTQLERVILRESSREMFSIKRYRPLLYSMALGLTLGTLTGLIGSLFGIFTGLIIGFSLNGKKGGN